MRAPRNRVKETVEKEVEKKPVKTAEPKTNQTNIKEREAFFLEDCESIGERFQFVRIAMGLSQEHVAEKIGIDRSTLSRFEQGTSISLEIVFPYSEIIGVPLRIIFDGVQPELEKRKAADFDYFVFAQTEYKKSNVKNILHR